MTIFVFIFSYTSIENKVNENESRWTVQCNRMVMRQKLYNEFLDAEERHQDIFRRIGAMEVLCDCNGVCGCALLKLKEVKAYEQY